MPRGLPKGVWPVMLTPFRDDLTLDWEGVDALTDWYLARGVAGLFAVCLSSEMYQLNPQERLDLAARIVRRVAGRVPVVAAGAFGDTQAQQAGMARRLVATGVSAVVLTVNQLAAEGEPDTVWQNNAAALCAACGDIPLGLYECPAPYHRTLSPALLRWAVQSGRFLFLKDTCCRPDAIEAKLEAVRGTSLRWFNANCPTLLTSLQGGGDGYCGIAANFFPELYVWLCRHAAAHPATAQRLQHFLSVADMAVRHKYPASAKVFLRRGGLPLQPHCRAGSAGCAEEELLVLDHLREAAAEWAAALSPSSKARL